MIDFWNLQRSNPVCRHCLRGSRQTAWGQVHIITYHHCEQWPRLLVGDSKRMNYAVAKSRSKTQNPAGWTWWNDVHTVNGARALTEITQGKWHNARRPINEQINQWIKMNKSVNTCQDGCKAPFLNRGCRCVFPPGETTAGWTCNERCEGVHFEACLPWPAMLASSSCQGR